MNPLEIFNAHQQAAQQGMSVNWHDVAARMAQAYVTEKGGNPEPEHRKAPEDPVGVG